MKKTDIIKILNECGIVLTEAEIKEIPENGIDSSEKVRLGAIRY